MPKAETCSRCGEEIRFGWRDGKGPTWLHREPVDHTPLHGQPFTEEMRAESERQRHVVRTRPKYDKQGNETGETETYTVAELDARKIKNADARKAALDELNPDDAEEGHDQIEPIEVHRTDMPLRGSLQVDTPDGPRTVTVPQGVRNIINPALANGWEVTRLTYARGPYLGASGKSLGVSDTVVLHVRGRRLDGSLLYGVGSWRDGKSDTAWRVEDNKLHRSGAKALIIWIKENPCGNSSPHQSE